MHVDKEEGAPAEQQEAARAFVLRHFAEKWVQNTWMAETNSADWEILRRGLGDAIAEATGGAGNEDTTVEELQIIT